jgi:hypothetical protein
LQYVNSKRKGTNDLVLLKLGENEITDDMDIAESMNTYFSSAFTEENLQDFPTMDRVVHDELSNVDCTDDEIESHLKHLEVNKSPGPDTILKECASQLAPSLTRLFNRSFYSGTLPHDWKLANIAPITQERFKT